MSNCAISVWATHYGVTLNQHPQAWDIDANRLLRATLVAGQLGGVLGIRELAHETNDATIVSAIIASGHSLDLRIVAEGVETERQQDFLTSVGCNSLQGYLLGQPMPPQQFLSAVTESSKKACQDGDNLIGPPVPLWWHTAR